MTHGDDSRGFLAGAGAVDTIVAFRVDAGSGKLAATGHVIETGSPSCIVFR